MVSKSGRVCLCDFSESNFNGFRYDEITTVVDKFKSPEREPGNLIDFRSDIYECGMLLDELTLKTIDISGRFVARANEDRRGPRENIQDFFVKQQIFNIIQKAVRPRPEDRFSSAAKMREQVEKLLTE
mgnify:CR=1 FL=1